MLFVKLQYKKIRKLKLALGDIQIGTMPKSFLSEYH